jgi:hypothetical protein
MSGTWYALDGIPRDPNAPTDGADGWVGTDGAAYGLNQGGERIPVVNGGPGKDTLLGLGEGDAEPERIRQRLAAARRAATPGLAGAAPCERADAIQLRP